MNTKQTITIYLAGNEKLINLVSVEHTDKQLKTYAKSFFTDAVILHSVIKDADSYVVGQDILSLRALKQSVTM